MADLSTAGYKGVVDSFVTLHILVDFGKHTSVCFYNRFQQLNGLYDALKDNGGWHFAFYLEFDMVREDIYAGTGGQTGAGSGDSHVIIPSNTWVDPMAKYLLGDSPVYHHTLNSKSATINNHVNAQTNKQTHR